MLRLTPITADTWLDLGDGVRVQVRPLTSVIMTLASEAVTKRADIGVTDIGDAASMVPVSAITSAVAQFAILAWEGVGDADGHPAPVTPDYVAALMAVQRYERAFFGAYVAHAFAVAAEKKGFAPLPNGTLAGAPTIAGDAEPSAMSAPGKSTGPRH